MNRRLETLTAGMAIVHGGDRVTVVDDDLAARFVAGDRLLVVGETGELLHVPGAAHDAARAVVTGAAQAFTAMVGAGDDQIGAFFDRFAAALESDAGWAPIAIANALDVADAAARGRSTTRLVADEAMRRDMIAGLRAWRDAPSARGRLVEHIDHDGWTLELETAPLGVVGFVFEGRPNVVADAAGVLRGGNTVVFRIGADALGTARAILRHALSPALVDCGLPPGAVGLIDEASHAAGWALFSDPRLSLAVARGSGPAVAQLGAVARQTGLPVSLHGTGGAWLVAAADAEIGRFASAVRNSLDRKVCNTLNVCCIVAGRAGDLVPAFLDALREAGAARGKTPRLHWVDPPSGGADGIVVEAMARADLGREWDWETTPEVSLVVVENVDAAVRLFNRHAPRFVASLIARNPAAHDAFYRAVDAPFVGDGFTRWVDGQYALNRPELGLSNWGSGRLFARGGILSGDGVFTVRARMRQRDGGLRR
ncbi:MAG: aldehyde dehydrogenase family protein [Caulobacteraceae bacterium]